jgi:hypothetical protein
MDAIADLGAWVWARHHNLASWYVRPFFILPYCWFAFRRNRIGLALTMLLFPTSLFWFPAPVEPSPEAERYLAWEQEFFLGSPMRLGALASVVAAFLWALAAAFWRRSWRWGLVVLNLASLMKVGWSLLVGGDAGQGSVLPTLVTLLVCDVAILAAVFHARRRPGNRRDAGRSSAGEARQTDA